MKRKNIVITIVLVIVLIAIFTNPSIEDHKEAVKIKFNANLQKKLNLEDGIVQAFSMMIGGVVLDGFVDNMVSSENYILFSITKITWDKDVKVVGIGAFGNVFISNKIDKAFENNLKNN
ncbi:MAG: hypothetical protein H6Q15_1913 [Bacteroidetes bacterium]|nr:hypothetical protein [Bacteroidota bacterium]